MLPRNLQAVWSHLHAAGRTLQARRAQSATRIEIPTLAGLVSGILHPVEAARAAAIMVGGSRGGTWGPAGIYAPLANRLQNTGVVSLRLHYRHPNHLRECSDDVLSGIDWLAERRIERVVVIGWSFGGAVVIGAAAASDRVAGVATVASQTYGTHMVGALSPKPLLLLHGTADRILPPRCSQDLYARAHQPKNLVLYPNDDHGLTRHANEVLDTLHDWCVTVLKPATEIEEIDLSSSPSPEGDIQR